MAFTYQARDLWGNQVPYFEADKITPANVAVVREMIFASMTRLHSRMSASADPFPYSMISSTLALHADASVVTP